MKKIVCSISTLSIGCTFVDWSIHFLAGKKQYYSFAQQKWMPLVSNPLTDCNAHGHDRNHPGGIENVTAMLQQAKNMPDDGLYSMYPCSSESNYVREKLKLDLEKINEKEFWQKELDWYADEYSKIFDCCINNTAKVIFIHDNESINWYKFFGHLRVKHNVPEHDLAEIEYKRQHFQKNSIDQWKNLKLENIWDNRERQALDLRLFEIKHTFEIK